MRPIKQNKSCYTEANNKDKKTLKGFHSRRDCHYVVIKLALNLGLGKL